METMWLKEAMFAGMTANAFKVGTVLTLGWFWVRVGGCSVLYRGSSMEAIEFANILAVAEVDASEIEPPNYVRHESSSTYFYVIRRANNCGQQEHTLAAAVKVSIDDNGDLVRPRPNSIFAAKAIQVTGTKVQLIWFYCPIGQEQQPACFKVYYDGGTGQIDYGDPVATINYEGRKFYALQTIPLQGDTYLLAIRAQGTNGMEDASLAQLRMQLDTGVPDTIDILKTETV